MTRLVIAVVGALILGGVAAPAQASQPAAKKYTSCADLLEKYPNGIAKNKKARNRAVKDGFARPRVSKKLYKSNRGRLDRDDNGVLCEQEGSRSISFKTDFGFITAQEVPAPKPGQCVDVPITMDVRNLGSVGSFGITVRLISEFGSVFAYEEVSTNQAIQYPYTIAEPGTLAMTLKACGDAHAWTHPSGNRQEPVAGVKTDERLALAFYRWLGDVPLGSEEYEFL